jgi:hypothetical protein
MVGKCGNSKELEGTRRNSAWRVPEFLGEGAVLTSPEETAGRPLAVAASPLAAQFLPIDKLAGMTYGTTGDLA